LKQAEETLINYKRQMLDTLTASRTLRDPNAITQEYRTQIDSMVQRFAAAEKNRISYEKEKLSAISGALDAMSPLKVLSRGYTIVSNQNGETVSSAHAVDPGEKVRVRFSDGSVNMSVIDIAGV